MQLVMPAVLGGELHQLLEDVGALAEGDVQFYAACVVEALQHLHVHGIAYRDLKADNVLLSGGFSSAAAGWPVLADFGLANFVQSDNLHSFCGTPAFVAPEVVTHSGHGTAADWWSLGVLIYQCFTLSTPFAGPHTKATLDNIAQGHRVHHATIADEHGNGGEESNTGELPARAAAIIDALLQHDPAERLGGALRSNEVRVHPFFWGFDWSSIEKRQMTPPHAARCRARAVLATQHPDLCLSPLPNLSAASEQPSASKDAPQRPVAAQAPAAARRMTCSTGSNASDDDEVDIGDYV